MPGHPRAGHGLTGCSPVPVGLPFMASYGFLWLLTLPPFPRCGPGRPSWRYGGYGCYPSWAGAASDSMSATSASTSSRWLISSSVLAAVTWMRNPTFSRGTIGYGARVV